MDVYLPIANLSVNGLWIVALGGLTGILSGLFGVGGGFLTTPLLIFYGIPPTVAAASASTQVTGASVTGVLAHGGMIITKGRLECLILQRAQARQRVQGVDARLRAEFGVQPIGGHEGEGLLALGMLVLKEQSLSLIALPAIGGIERVSELGAGQLVESQEGS